jgi:hypothetical protein
MQNLSISGLDLHSGRIVAYREAGPNSGYYRIGGYLTIPTDEAARLHYRVGGQLGQGGSGRWIASSL